MQLYNQFLCIEQPGSMSIHPEDMSSLLSSHGPSLAENSENDLQHHQLDHSDNIDGEYRLVIIIYFHPFHHANLHPSTQSYW